MSENVLSKSENEVKLFLEDLIKHLGASSVRVELVSNDHHRKSFEVYTDIVEDRGKIIGKKGQNINALNTLLNAYAKQLGMVFETIHLNDD
jgi:predicted RNA-binding protein YlqC (UPF0109 family)